MTKNEIRQALDIAMKIHIESIQGPAGEISMLARRIDEFLDGDHRLDVLGAISNGPMMLSKWEQWGWRNHPRIDAMRQVCRMVWQYRKEHGLA